MAKFIKCEQSVSITLRGKVIAEGTYYQLPVEEEAVWASDSSVITALSGGYIAVSDRTDETNDITDVAQGIAFLKGEPPVDADTGAPLSSPKFAPTGWYQKVHEFEFTSAKLNSLEDEKSDLTDYNYGNMTFLDASGVALTTQADIDANCVLTQADWTTPHDVMVLAGFSKQITKPTTRAKIWGIGAPGLPTAMGGHQVFVDGVNLEFVEPGNEVGIAGVAGRILPHTPLGGNQYVNTIRFQLWTPDQPGFQHRIQCKMNIFVPPGY